MNIYRRKGKDGKLASPFYYYRFKYGGRDYRGSTETADAALARKVLNKRYNEIVETGVLGSKRRADIPTVEKYAQAFLDGYALNKKTRGNDKLIIEKSIKPAFGKKRLDELTSADVERWRNTRLKADKQRGEGTVSPAGIRLEMACLKTIMGLAVRDGLIDINPVSSVRMPRVNNARDRVITPKEYKKLLAKVTKRVAYMTPIVALAYQTGMRRGEILGLRWRDLQKRPGFAYLADTKNGTHRWVPLNAAARTALATWPRRTDTDHVLARPDGRAIKDIKKAWWSLCKDAKVKDARFHDLRHTFTTRALESGMDIRTIMAITGHKDASMFQRYSHPSDSHLKTAVEALGVHTGGHTGSKAKKGTA